MILISYLLFNSLLLLAKCEYKSYRNYTVYNTVPSSQNDVEFLKKIQENGVDSFWTDLVQVGKDVKIMVAPERQNEFLSSLKSFGINSTIAIPDVQLLIDAQYPKKNNNRLTRNYGDFDWEEYHTIDEINMWLQQLTELYPDVVTLVVIGRTFEGRDITGVKIDYKKRENPTIGMIEGGIHSREWISPATVTFIIKEFLTSDNADVRALAENIVWHIFPSVNPDGYDYTFNVNRMWRKNRNTDNFQTCAAGDDMSNGIDLNRNFGYRWMTVGASSNPCTETFAGPTAFSEAETSALANYVLSLKQQGTLVYYIAFHSYSQLLLIPYSHAGESDVLEAWNYADLYEMGIKAMDKLTGLYGTRYVVGTSKDILYEVSGSSFDWAKGEADVPITFLFELRDTGVTGFLLPPEQIISNSEEIMVGLLEMDRYVRQFGYYVSSSCVTNISSVLFILLVYLMI